MKFTRTIHRVIDRVVERLFASPFEHAFGYRDAAEMAIVEDIDCGGVFGIICTSCCLMTEQYFINTCGKFFAQAICFREPELHACR